MLEIFTTDIKGRGLKNTTGIRRGNVVVSSTPFVYVLSKKQKGIYCDHCFRRKEKLLRCSRCKYMSYCDQKCQRESWKLHKKECLCLKNVSPKIPPDFVILLTRIFLKFEDLSDLKNVGDLISVIELESNYEKLSEHQKNGLSQFLLVVKSYWGTLPNQLQNVKDVLNLCAKIKNNSFAISDEQLQFDIGTGVYLSCSLLNHSCNPNCVVEFDNLKLNVRALRNIEPNEELLISYVDLFAPSFERQKQLSDIYGFLCCCEFCSTKVNDQEMLQDFGGTKMSDSKLDDINNFLSDLHKLNENKKFEEILNLTEKFISRKVLPNENVYMAKVLDFAMDSAIELKQFEVAFKFGSSSLPAYKKYLNPNHPMSGLQILKLGKICFYYKQLDEAIPLLLKAMEILQVTHSDGGNMLTHVKDLINKAYLEQNILKQRK